MTIQSLKGNVLLGMCLDGSLGSGGAQESKYNKKLERTGEMLGLNVI